MLSLCVFAFLGCRSFLFQTFRNCTRRLHAGGACLRKPSGHARAVARREEAGKLCLQILVELQPCRVELDLRAVKKRIIVRRARGDFVELIDHLNDVIELPLGKRQREVARNRCRERGADGRLLHAVLIRALAVDQIAEALHLSEATVKNHLKRIFDKLGLDGGARGKRMLLADVLPKISP